MTRENGRRPGRNFRIAAQVKGRFVSLMDEQTIVTAIATCRIHIQGAKSTVARGKNWGNWVRTRMQTFGGRITGYNPGKDYKLALQGQWASFNCERILSDLLFCLGDKITVQNFYDFYGEPEKGKIYVVDFVDVIANLAPELLKIDESQIA